MALYGLQEYIQLAVALCRDATRTPQHGRIMAAVNVVVPALLEKVESLIDAERSDPPRLGGQWLKLRSLLDLGPPTLDRGYYLFGLLDCAAQLAALIYLSRYRPTLLEMMTDLISTSNIAEYRWLSVRARRDIIQHLIVLTFRYHCRSKLSFLARRRVLSSFRDWSR